MEIDVECSSPTAEDFLLLDEIYRRGDDIQKVSVIRNLPQLIILDSNSTYTKIIPKILQELPKASVEFHLACSKMFRVLMEKPLPVNLLTAVFQGIESRDPIIADCWLETLLGITPILPESSVQEIIKLAQTRAAMAKSVVFRITSCKVIGKIVIHPRAEQLEFKKNVLPLVQSLCQDTSHEVRAAMCFELPAVAQALGPSLVKQNLMPNIVELASDENQTVRSAAVVTVGLLIPMLPQDIKVSTIIPLVKKLCEKCLMQGDNTYTTVSNEFGKILDGLQTTISNDDALWFLNFYKSLSLKGFASDSKEATQGVLCRQQCAFNLPIVTYFTFSKIPAQNNLWYTIFRGLSGDPCYLVRKTVAACVHEVARILGAECKLIKQDIVRLLRDDAEEVLQMLVPNLGVTLELFNSHGLLSRDTSSHTSTEIGRALLKCHMELAAGYNWRMQSLLMYQFEHLPNCMPSDFIHQYFTPIVLNVAVQGRARPVRSQAARTLLVFLRYNTKEVQRKWIRDTLIARLCYSQSCYTRHIFIKMCFHALDIFSNKYFKEFFFMPLLGLLDDRVSTVRLCVTAALPFLKVMLTPEDRKLQQCLDSAITKLENLEKTKEIVLSYRSKMQTVKNVEKQFKPAEEKRRQDEEIKIADGKPVAVVRTGYVVSGQRVPSFINLQKDAPKTPAQTGGGGGGGGTPRPSPSQQQPLNKPVAVANKPPVPGQPPQVRKMSTTQVPSRPGSAQVSRPASAAVANPNPADSGPISDMSFLEQHFYIDAGIDLTKTSQNLNSITLRPKKATTKRESGEKIANYFQSCIPLSVDKRAEISSGSLLEEEEGEEHSLSQISTISLENTDVSKLSENDIKLLENTTTNITDDVKVNLRNISIRKRNKAEHERNVINKRYSSVYQENRTACNLLKRRSLNIGTETSRIPVSFKHQRAVKFNVGPTKKPDEQHCVKENNNFKRYSLDLGEQYSFKPGVSGDCVTINSNEVPKIAYNKEPSPRMASGLPVLKKKSQSEVARK